MEAGDYHNPALLNLEKDSIGKTPHSRTPPSPIDDRKLQRVFCNCLKRCLDCEREALPKFRAFVVVPCPGFLQILIGLWYPDDWESQDFLNSPALTCSQGMTSEGFCSCRAMR
jgi:hypothetical protein